jgi:hypothetical protein
MSSVNQIMSHRRDEAWSTSLLQTFFDMTMGILTRNDIKLLFWVLIDLIIGFLVLIIKAFDNQTEIWS